MKTESLRFAVTVALVLPSLFFTGCSSTTTAGSSTPAPAVVYPTVVAIAPAKLAAGAASTTLTITGTNFIANSAVQVGSVVEPTTFASSTQLTATVPASQLLAGAMLPVIVLNGPATSAAGTTFNLEIDNPSPAITGFLPSTLLTGTATSTLTVTGSGFVPTTTIQVNGVAHSTAYVNPTQVSAILTAADLATAGNLTLLAINPAPGGGTSAAASVPVSNPAPIATVLTPSTVLVGAAPATITVTGSGFVPSSIVQVGTVARATTYVSSTQLTFTLTAADQAAPGRLSVTVVNPAPGGGTSSALLLNVITPTPTATLTSVSPSSFVVGAPSTSILIQGTNFSATSIAQWNGTALASQLYNPTTLYATVPASLLAATGTASITVNTPSAIVPLSNALTVTITNPPTPTLTSISPNNGPINTVNKVTLIGTGFTTNSTAAYNGTILSTTFVSSTSLSVTLSAAADALPGNGNFTVSTPAPGGGTSTPQVFTAYIPLVSNNMVYNPTDGLIYASIPGSVGAPMGNSIVSINPATGAFGTPIFVGSEPDKLALTADGKFLWVTLDGPSGVRKVDLTAKTAGLQFTIAASNSGIYNPPASVLSLAALPGATDSVVLSTSNASTPLIYDAGVLRGAQPAAASYSTSTGYALQIDPTKTEIYSAGSGYATFVYSSAGVTAKASNTTISPATSNQDEVQLLGGRLYTDEGKIYDAESGALLGTIYLTGTTPATGTTLADTTLGKIFVLDNAAGNYSTAYNQIQIFNTSDYTANGAIIPINVSAPSTTSSYYNTLPTRLARWGANGLVFHTTYGIYSLRSNAVNDLSASSADLGVAITSAGATTTGANSTFTVKVSNAGPSTADATLTVQTPAIGSLVSVVPSAGSCSASAPIACTFNGLASGASASVVVTILQTTAGASTLTAQVTGSVTDANPANNAATATVTVTGSDFSVVPALTSISPASIQSGAADTVLTIAGSGFINGSTIQFGSTTLPTTYVSATSLKATIPAASLTALGWSGISVSTPAPGGGSSNVLPLSIYSVLTVGINHILYDPYSRQIMASVGSGSSSITGNSIAAITPETSAISTPVSIGSQPTNLALSSDGQILYTILTGSQSVARFNMLTRQADFTYTPPSNSSFAGGIALRGISVQPGTENTIALDIAAFTGNAIYDFNPTTKTAAIRGQASGPYSGSCISFLDSANLLAFDTDTSGATFDHYTVTASGFTYYNYSQYTQSTLKDFGCFKLSGGLAFANGGGIANPAPATAVQIATLPGATGGGFSTQQAIAPDASLKRAFFPNVAATYAATADGISAFDLSSYLLSTSLSLNMAVTEGSTSYSLVDMVRWGQDGLAILTSGGHVYLMRGPVVVPGLLGTGTAATITTLSSTTIAHGTGNTLLTITGTNFAPGVAVTYNGNYRTTTIVDPTHVTVAIPSTDLATTGTATLTATNPGAPASSALTLTIN